MKKNKGLPPILGQVPYSEYERQPDIHDELPPREKLIADLFLQDYGTTDNTVALAAFDKGFHYGLARGHADGFNQGAKTAINGLTGVADRGERARTLASGNSLSKPKNNLEAINRDQLTAEVCNVLAQYAVMPVDARVAAVIDALNSLPGVEIKT